MVDLFVNGDFSNGFTGWSGNGTVVGGVCHLTNSKQAYQNPPLVLGVTYTYEFDYEWPASAPGLLHIFAGSSVDENPGYVSGSQHFSATFTATQDDVDFPDVGVSNSSGATVYVDNFVLWGPGSSSIQNVFLVASDSSGDIQLINAGTNDDSVPIFYELETQDIEMGNRFSQKQIQDKIVVLTDDAQSSTVQFKQDDQDYKPLKVNLNNEVSISDPSKFQFHFGAFKWLGNTTNMSPVLDGFYLEKVVDNGLI